MDVSIIIVNYNTKKLLADCLKSIYNQTNSIVFEVIVSDNGSADGSIEMLKADFPQVILIENNSNLGFGAANNRGLAIAKGKYIFYLNSDTILLNNAVKIFFDYFEEYGEKNSIGALGCNLLDYQNNYNHSFELQEISINEILNKNFHITFGIYKETFLNMFLKNPFSKLSFRNEKKCKYLGEVKQIIGADLFIKNNEDAKFDENYFLYREESDLEHRLLNKGKRLYIIDGPQIIHLEGGSQKNKKTYSLIEWYQSPKSIFIRLSEIYYFKKYNFNSIKLFILRVVITIMWLNPLLFKQTRKYILKLWKI